LGEVCFILYDAITPHGIGKAVQVGIDFDDDLDAGGTVALLEDGVV
jgi:hypothetical protein